MRASFLLVAMFLITPVATAGDGVPSDSSAYCGTRPWRPLLEDAARRFEVSAAWLESILRVESAGCEYWNGFPTMSSAGAMGLMQLMPSTWQRLQIELHLGADPFDPHDNILAGAGYLRELYDQFGLVGAIAAYHAGPTLYGRHLRDGEALPSSTVDYVRRVLANINTEPPNESVFARGRSELATGIKSESIPGALFHATTVGLDRGSVPAHSRGLFINLRHQRRR